MKREMVCIVSAIVALMSAMAEEKKTFSRDEFRIRDPFVLAENGTYYLYESKPWNGGKGVAVRTSKDLENWTDKEMVMTLPSEVNNTAVWAPEVHKYKGAYWLFTTLTFPVDPAKPIKPMTQKGFKGGNLQPRGVWVFKSDSPRGPFKPVKNGSVTPADWMCLDGTLWVEDGVPWMVFCHEWCQTGNGRMMAAPMNEDLSAFTAEPIELFRAADVSGGRNVTDGPFLMKPKGVGLRMIWSNFIEGHGYCVIQCKSISGKVKGPWVMHTPLFENDGGHGMLFKTFDDKLMITLHQPNKSPNERMKIYPIGTTWEGLSRIDWNPFGPDWQKKWTPEVEKEIDERIEKVRKADAVVDSLPAGAEVKVEQISSKFLFGAHLFNYDQLGSDALNATYRAAFTNYFNSGTIAFYWKEFEPEEGKKRYVSGPRDEPAFWNAFDFKNDEPEKFVEWRRPAPDRVIDFCRKNNIEMHGHAILYYAWSPKWLFKKVTTPEIARDYFDRRVAEIAQYYKDVIPQWDVVNESMNRGVNPKENPVDNKSWYRTNYGTRVLPPEWTRRAFEVAAANFPSNVLLAINDAWSMQNNAYAAFAKKLISQGAKIDVVGYQKHIFQPMNMLTIASGYPCLTNTQNWDLKDEAKRLAEIDEMGLPIHISEITIPSPRGLGGLTDEQADEIQARVTRAYYRFWFSWPSVNRITYWNWIDGLGIKNERMSSGWFNRDMTPKKVAKVMDDLINREWRTRLILRADTAGKISFRGFKGRYRLSWIDANNKKCTREITVD